jgi:hypothetical protein
MTFLDEVLGLLHLKEFKSTGWRRHYRKYK